MLEHALTDIVGVSAQSTWSMRHLPCHVPRVLSLVCNLQLYLDHRPSTECQITLNPEIRLSYRRLSGHKDPEGLQGSGGIGSRLSLHRRTAAFEPFPAISKGKR